MSDNQTSSITSAASSTSPMSAPAGSARRGWFAVMMITLLLIALAIIWFFRDLDAERTEDAQVNGNVVQVTSQISGTVIAINADDTDYVNAGDPLIKLNPVDQEIAYEKAQAALAKATRSARSQYLQVAQSKADLAQKQSDVLKARADLARRIEIASIGAVSREEVSHTQEALRSAQAALESTRQLLAQRTAQIDNTVIRSHPDVVAAATDLRDAYIARRRSVIPAPVNGTVVKRTAQIGQRISAGMALMSLVPLNNLWVTANFKESQLKDIRIGQPVKLTADVYGPDVVYHGKVIGLDAGTGSAFSLLPAQNATGNWIKVTQRVPVKIALNPKEVSRHPLRLGLSMRAIVDTSDRHGDVIRSDVATDFTYSTHVFSQELKDANEEVESVIHANEGSPASPDNP